MNPTDDAAGSNFDSDDQRREPLRRLMASRARLRAELIPARRFGAAGKPATTDGGLAGRARALWELLASRGSRRAVFTGAAGLLRNWWVRQPWHATTELLGHAVADEVSPWVRRHPVAAVTLGAFAGAAVVVARPWRWHVVGSQSRVMGRSLGRWTVSQLTQPTVQMALAAALAAWLERRQSSSVEDGPRSTMAPAPAHAPKS